MSEGPQMTHLTGHRINNYLLRGEDPLDDVLAGSFLFAIHTDPLQAEPWGEYGSQNVSR